MAGRGPAPKPADQRRRRNKEPDALELPAEGNVKPYPELPPTYRSGEIVSGGKKRAIRSKFLPETRAWYVTWATSPQATEFSPPTWQRLLRLARLVDQFEREPDKGLLSEIRLQEASLGGTPADMLRLRWRIAEASEDGPKLASVATIGDRRRRAVDKTGG
ncbi:unannotated protein [freshwater metagenome]|uniref:Unannotated protein n=1 Tax=freshwater metagenome TaxID=449393 RepID=A0A6J7GGD5_9ZZZZ|nr:hypothetical protein [Actinomycetota bacterium]